MKKAKAIAPEPTPKPPRRKIFLPRANPMFLPEMSVLLRFVIYAAPVECPNCGEKAKQHWTMLCPFKATSMGMQVGFELKMEPRVYQPGETVCDQCLMGPTKAVTDLFCFPRQDFWQEIGEAGEQYMARCRKKK